MEFGGPDHQPGSLYSAMKHAEYPLSIKLIGQRGTKRRSRRTDRRSASVVSRSSLARLDYNRGERAQS